MTVEVDAVNHLDTSGKGAGWYVLFSRAVNYVNCSRTALPGNERFCRS